MRLRTLESDIGKKIVCLGLVVLFAGTTVIADETSYLVGEETWANQVRRWDGAFKNIPSRSLPGRTMGVIVPSDTRDDLLPMTAFSYEVVSRGSFHTAVILMPAPADSTITGVVTPAVDSIETSFGRFVIDNELRQQLVGPNNMVKIDPTMFTTPDLPKILLRQLSALKFVLRSDVTNIKILPMYVKLSDFNSETKDLAPYLVDRIRDHGLDTDVMFIIISNMTRAPEDKIVQADATMLKAIRELDVETLLGMKEEGVTHDDFGVFLLGLLTMRWMGADHADVFAYAHSGQMVLTKDKKTPISYVSAGFASKPPIFPKVAHVPQEKMVEIFGELLRSDLLALARQTCNSTLDPTAAKPPAVNTPQAAKKWPVYISIFDPQGKLAGLAGSHKATGPLEESIRKYTFDAVRRAQPELTKANGASYVIEISIPYGFESITRPDEYIPLLTGVIVEQKLKTQAMHPDTWRMYPDPHQLLGVISTRLGSEPWAYATTVSKLDSFRVFSFNEKEPFQDLGVGGGKKKKKKGENPDDDLDAGGGGGTGSGGGGGGAFGF